MSCLRVVQRRALVTLLLCAGVACALSGVPATLGSALSSTEMPKKRSHQAGLGLTFAERVSYQRTIEEVRWRHRIWPKDNPQAKPSLDAILSQARLKKKVADYLRTSQALEEYWQRPIAAEELQAEIERMARDTKQPNVLRELFEALGDDPFVIAECLARPILAERLVAELFKDAKNTSFRAEPRNSAARLIGDSTGNRGFVQDDIGANPGNAGYKLPEISTDCANDTWTSTTIVNAPEARWGHSAVWTGSEMIIWGGSFLKNGYQYFDTGGRYDPATDSWTATSTTSVPTARWRHGAVWTGSEMIVWGGYGGNDEFFATGGRYNPTDDAWTAMSTANAPIARISPTVVWTDGEMIVWGGYNYTNGRFNSGGRYNPITDSWVATSTTDAPSARWLHTALWTHSEMIVWGGTDETNPLNTGGRYNPSTDSWTPTGVPNDVLGRAGHTAVWAGTGMIVWGGADSTFNDCNTGGIYDPTEDSWAATGTVNAPSPRDSHTAVWTGSEMIVWGGVFCCPPVDFDTGGRYDAATDSWTATSTADAPLARSAHTAVWTGSEMLVWGGYNDPNNLFLDTGGRYCAKPAATPTPTTTVTPTATPSATPTATVTATPRIAPTPRARPTPRPRP